MLENRLPNDPSNYSLEEMDRQSLFHPLTSIATHMEKGRISWRAGTVFGCVITAGGK
jgi:hypothetical protein